jgi:hypothetical protein
MKRLGLFAAAALSMAATRLQADTMELQSCANTGMTTGTLSYASVNLRFRI